MQFNTLLRQNMKNENREKHFDTLKLIAVFVVYSLHFIGVYHQEYSVYWHKFPTSLILEGVAGKNAVSALAVFSGYFAYKSKQKPPTIYFLRRWFEFFIAALLINSIWALCCIYGWGGVSSNIISNSTNVVITVLIESLSINSSIYPALWILKPFLIGSFFSYLNGIRKSNTTEIIIQIMLFCLIDQVWISICLIGTLVASIQMKDTIMHVYCNTIIRIIVIITVFVVIKRKESNLTYFIDGICMSQIILLIDNSKRIKRILSNRLLAGIGKNVMAIFLIHAITYRIVSPFLFQITSNWTYKYSFLFSFGITWLIIVGLSYPVNWFLNRAMRMFTKVIYNINLNIRRQPTAYNKREN